MVNGKEVAVYDSIYKNGKAVAVKQYVGRLPYEKFKDPTNPDLNYLNNLNEEDGKTPQEKSIYQSFEGYTEKICGER